MVVRKKATAKKTVRKKKKPVKVKFEMTRGSIFGVAVVCFCLFLWMFLIGVWTGQSILAPYTQEGEKTGGVYQSRVKQSSNKTKNTINSPEVIRAEGKKKLTSDKN